MCPGIVLVGTSLGGLAALEILLKGFKSDFAWPIVIVQHRNVDSTNILPSLLQKHCSLSVKEAEDSDLLEAGFVYIGPADYHLLIESGQLALSLEAPVRYARPSIDLLFESGAQSYGPRVIAVVLTGSNNDGQRGATAVKNQGGVVIVQDPFDAESQVMPKAVIDNTPVDGILKLEEIAPFIADYCQSDRRNLNDRQ